MQRKFLGLLAVLACILMFINGCSKLDTTVIGEDLITIDNISTFDTILPITAVREQLIDSTRLGRSETHALGRINNDPVFGKTQADIFLELKPAKFPFYFGNANDTINPGQNPKTHYDSAFLCLSVVGFYGDTTRLQHLRAYELDQSTSNFTDTVAHKISFEPEPPSLNNLIGEGSFDVRALRNYTVLADSARDSVNNQIRIKLTPAFLAKITSGDTSVSGPNNFFRSDSLFKAKFKGFAVVAEGSSDGNGLFYISLMDAKTRLEVHYTAATSANKPDVAFSSLIVSTSPYATPSATANRIKRDTTGSELTHPDNNALYVRSTPGSAIRLTIPGLSTFPNSVIHRAEIFLDEVLPAVPNNPLTPPQYLYLDLINDTSANGQVPYKPIYYDLNPNEYYNPDNPTPPSFFPSAIDNGYYGGYLRSLTDASGKRSYYTFNLTRYIQNTITKKSINYKMRVYAPYSLTYYGLKLLYKNNLAAGDIKIYNGSDPNYRIRMRLVYSRIK